MVFQRLQLFHSKIAAAEIAAHGDRLSRRELYGLPWPFSTRTRFPLLIMVQLCMTINWANIGIFNFTIICMAPPPNASVIANDSSAASITFTSQQKFWATAVVALAALITNLPIVIVINKYGSRYLFTFLGFFGAAATALIPVALEHRFWAFLICRALQGAAFAGDMSAMGSYMAHWTYYKQYAISTATLCTYVQLAPIFTNPVAASLCVSRWGWRSVYYVHAGIACVLFTIFFLCYRNNPIDHPFVGKIEQKKLTVGRSDQAARDAKPLPYWRIVRNMPFWAVVVGSIGNFCGVNVVYIGSPVFLNKVMGFQVAETGFMAALPPLLMATFKEVSGAINDKLTCIPETARTKIYNSIAFFIMAAALCVVGFIPTNHGVLALAIMTAGMSFLGFNVGGFYKSGTLIAGRYAPFVVGQTSNGITLSLIIVPIIIELLDKNDTQAQWRAVFLCVAGILVATNIFYLIFSSGQLQSWAKDDFDLPTGQQQIAVRSSIVISGPKAATGGDVNHNNSAPQQQSQAGTFGLPDVTS